MLRRFIVLLNVCLLFDVESASVNAGNRVLTVWGDERSFDKRAVFTMMIFIGEITLIS